MGRFYFFHKLETLYCIAFERLFAAILVTTLWIAVILMWISAGWMWIWKKVIGRSEVFHGGVFVSLTCTFY
jgi:hypothetical protein